MKYLFTLLLILLAFLQMQGEGSEKLSKKEKGSQVAPLPYVKHPRVSDETWEAVQPYLLPIDHPIKPSLDAIFKVGRPSATYEAMMEAGFSSRNRGDHLVAAKHPKLKGYLVKVFLDVHELTDEWKAWIHRIQGARQIQESIDRHNYGDLLKAPKKWIYPICSVDATTQFLFPKYFILVVEDMYICPYPKNASKFFHVMDEKRMEALYVILSENFLIDSCFIDNIPFCKDGRNAFIDTEHFNVTDKPMRYERITSYFSSRMQRYWTQLTQQE